MASVSPGNSYRQIRDSLPADVTVVVAAKGRTPQEVAEVIDAGAVAIGENYVQEAAQRRAQMGDEVGRAQWHLIGHLQRNKVKQVLPLFDVIQSVDSLRLARAIDSRATEPVSVLVEVNIAGEESKFGAPFDHVPELVRQIGDLPGLRVQGLMTMEPLLDDANDARPYFRRMRALFEDVAAMDVPNVEMRVLSMGMTNSYRVAVEEGANMVRIGTAIFGPRGS